jgi:NSS family neurotransmitter:Na+ symporter
MEKKSRSKFSSKLGFVLAAAGSAVGLGNIWRFPYLAAKYGGGIFLLVYLILAFTFGYTMIMTESTLGRMTEKSPVGAYKHFGASKFLKAGGWLNAIIPLLIVPYYSVIGGWVMKYLFTYLSGNGSSASKADAFAKFTTSAQEQVFWFVLFTLITMLIIFGGVRNGIEAVSKIMMPILVFLAIVIVFYSVTRPGAIKGVKYFLIPNFSQFSYKTVVAALGQMFYSLSIAMGILYTFGSYMKKDIDIEKTTKQVEIFDTAIAVLAGLMVIPAVFAFDGGKNLNAGPGLMFVALPKVFNSMGFGGFIGVVFFLLVLLAAVTSSVALAESVVSTFEDELHFTRKRAATVTATIMLILGTLSALGFNVLSSVKIFNMDILSFFDFLTNSVMMPIAAIATCVLVLKVVKIKTIEDEIKTTSKFRRKFVYNFVIKYVAIIFLLVILVTSVLGAFGFKMFQL